MWYEYPPTLPSLLVIALLLALLIAKELARAHGGMRTPQRMRWLDAAILPLLLATGVAVALRFARLLRML